MEPLLPLDYFQLLGDIKARVRRAQIKAVVAVNSELVGLYLQIGQTLSQRQGEAGWGDAVVTQLSRDLRREFPGTAGFSRSNLFAMRQVYLAYRDEPEIVQQAVGHIPWGHNVLLVSRVKEPQQRAWYLAKAAEHGWSRAVLDYQIETDLYSRQLPSATSANFERTLPPPQSDMARSVLKDTYILDFLDIGDEAKERELERALVGKITEFLMELGAGFAFMGSQYHLPVAGQDFYVDLLFYHHRLRCLVAIDLKTGDFQPEFAGKMNFYLSALDDLVRHPDDQPSIGIILCKNRNSMLVEYALRDMNKPIGVANHRYTKQLPHEIAGVLPNESDWQRVLEVEEADADSGPLSPDSVS